MSNFIHAFNCTPGRFCFFTVLFVLATIYLIHKNGWMSHIKRDPIAALLLLPFVFGLTLLGSSKPPYTPPEPGLRRPAPPSLSEIIQSSRIEREIMDEARDRVMSGRCDHDDWIIYVLSNAGEPGTITEVDLSQAREALLRRVRQRLEEPTQ